MYRVLNAFALMNAILSEYCVSYLFLRNADLDLSYFRLSHALIFGPSSTSQWRESYVAWSRHLLRLV